MTTSPRAGTLADPSMLVNVPAADDGVLHASGPTRRCPRSGSRSGRRGTAARRLRRRVQRGAHPRHQRRRSATTARAQGIDGPLFLGIDTHALSEAGVRERARGAGRERGRRDDRRPAAGYTPTPVVSHAILTHNRGRTTGLADGIVITPSHNPPEDGGFKYNPPNGGPGRHRRHAVDPGPGERAARGRLDGRRAHAVRAGAARRDDAPPRLPGRLRRRPRARHRHRRHARRRGDARRRSAGRRRRAYWARRSPSATGCRLTVRERRRGSDLPLHDARLGREDPDGLLVAVRDAAPDRAQGPLRRRLGLRHRPRPARHRHPERRAC